MSSSDRKSYSADETRDSVHVISGGSELKVAEVRLTKPDEPNCPVPFRVAFVKIE